MFGAKLYEMIVNFIQKLNTLCGDCKQNKTKKSMLKMTKSSDTNNNEFVIPVD